MPEMPKNLGVTMLVLKISCVVDNAKLPDLVNVAVLWFIYFWRKMTAFQPLREDTVMKIQFERIHLVNYYSPGPFTLKSSKTLFCKHRMAMMVEVFEGAAVKKSVKFVCSL